MLKKEAMTPGVKVRVADPRDGLPANLTGGAGQDHSLPYVRVGNTPAPTGTVLEIVRRPRRTGGRSLIRVKFVDGPEGEVYWCELRASCVMA